MHNLLDRNAYALNSRFNLSRLELKTTPGQQTLPQPLFPSSPLPLFPSSPLPLRRSRKYEEKDSDLSKERLQILRCMETSIARTQTPCQALAVAVCRMKQHRTDLGIIRHHVVRGMELETGHKNELR